MMGKNIVFILVFSLIFLPIIEIQTYNVEALDSTLTVDINGDYEYTSIQDAINIANNGDTVFVYSGYYTENLIINKPIDLIGENKDNTTIDGNNDITVSVFSDNVELEGFTIKNGTKGIMLNNSSKNTIKENTIINNNYGIYIDNESTNNTIYQNNFIDNTKNAYDLSTNFWNFSSNGNYWDDYIGSDENDDGIGDISYNISGRDGQDMYPLMVPIFEKPIADFSHLPYSSTTQDIIKFIDESIGIDGQIVSWSWDFGDGTTSIEQNATHKYADDGIYNIILKVTDNYGLTNETAQKISVLNEEPTADFDYSPATPTDLQNVTFIDTSIDLDGEIVSWSWDFGDGNSSTLKTPSHKYDDNGTYTVTLIATDDDGASDSTSQQIKVLNAAPTASFFVLFNNVTILVNDEIQFKDSSKDLDGNIISWHWDLGDGTTSTEKQLIHVYSSNGVYKVLLTVTDNDGASSIETKHVTVSSLTEVHEIEKGFSTFDIVFVIFIIIMVAMVIFLSKKYG